MPWYNVKVVGKQRVKWATPFFSQDAASVFKLIIFVQLTVNFLKLKISGTELSGYTYQSCDPKLFDAVEAIKVFWVMNLYEF